MATRRGDDQFAEFRPPTPGQRYGPVVPPGGGTGTRGRAMESAYAGRSDFAQPGDRPSSSDESSTGGFDWGLLPSRSNMLRQPMGMGSSAEQAMIAHIQARSPNRIENHESSWRVAPSTVGEQLKMFMTPKEIHAGWQPLDADREEASEGTYVPARTGTGTGQEGWHMPQQIGAAIAARGAGSPPDRVASGSRGYYRTPGGGREYAPGEESDQQLWARKLEETTEYGKHGQHEADWGGGSQDPNRAIHTQPGTGESGGGDVWGGGYDETMYENIERKGVQGPVHLGRTIGSMGKPEIVGGHHRIAAATDISARREREGKSELFLPVQHWEDFWEAKRSGHYA